MRFRQQVHMLTSVTEPFGQRLGLMLTPLKLLCMSTLCKPALAQMPGGPPSVGVVKAEPTAITESSEFIGRIQAINRVALTARVTAFLDQRFFTEGAEVKQGDLLYRLPHPPLPAPRRGAEAGGGGTR